MIRLPNHEEINELIAFNAPHSVTIYVPFLKSNAAANPNKIEFKNLLAKAKIALKTAGASSKDIKKTLRPALMLLNDDEFWLAHRESLAFFMHSELFSYYLVPDANFPYIATVKKGFNLGPLQDVISHNKEYFVLALSHKKVKLYKGDLYELGQVQLKNLPSDMKTTLNIDEYPRVRELHQIAPANQGKGSAAYHGQYNIKETDKDMLLQFFRIIDKRLRTFLASKNEPLILAGTQYLQPIYRKVNSYPNILPNAIKGNVDKENLESLRTKALLALSSIVLIKSKQHA